MSKTKKDLFAGLTARLGKMKEANFGADIEETIALAQKPVSGGAANPDSPFRMMDIAEIEIDMNRNIRTFDQEGEEFLALCETIREKGILQNLCVEPNPDGKKPHRLIFGFRRIHAAIKLGMTQVPVFVQSFESDAGRILAALIENLTREEMVNVQISRSVFLLTEKGIPAAQLMTLFTWEEEKTVRKHYRIGSWSEEIRAYCYEHRKILNLKFLFNKIKDEVAADEAKLMAFLRETVEGKPKEKPVEPAVVKETRLALAKKVEKVSVSQKNGHFHVSLTLTPAQLDRLKEAFIEG